MTISQRADDLHRLQYLFPCDIEVRDGADAVGASGQNAESLSEGALDEFSRGHASHAEADDVGFDGGGIDLDAGATGDSLGEKLRVGMVFDQPCPMMP